MKKRSPQEGGGELKFKIEEHLSSKMGKLRPILIPDLGEIEA